MIVLMRESRLLPGSSTNARGETLSCRGRFFVDWAGRREEGFVPPQSALPATTTRRQWIRALLPESRPFCDVLSGTHGVCLGAIARSAGALTPGTALHPVPMTPDASTSDAATSATTPSRPTECPQCGSKLPDSPFSLCPYCASPLETAADRKKLESVNASRIKRVREHATFAEAEAWNPPESQDWHSGARRVWWMLPLLGMAVLFLVLVVIPPLGRGFDAGGIVATVLAAGLAGYGFYLGTVGKAMKSAAVERPLMKRPGLIVDRRSDTRIRGWGDGDTIYYFTIELEDGNVGEFRFPGLGAKEDPYATNLPGMAYTRGTELLHFRHVRV
jgi:hypothetical protein